MLTDKVQSTTRSKKFLLSVWHCLLNSIPRLLHKWDQMLRNTEDGNTLLLYTLRFFLCTYPYRFPFSLFVLQRLIWSSKVICRFYSATCAYSFLYSTSNIYKCCLAYLLLSPPYRNCHPWIFLQIFAAAEILGLYIIGVLANTHAFHSMHSISSVVAEK